MLYYHAYLGYADYGNHSNDGYDEYEPYSDYTEPDHWEPEPTPSEPNHHDYDHIMDATEYNHHANCEYNADNANREVNEAYQPQWSKYEGDEVQELEELIHDRDGMDWEGRCEGEVEEHELEREYKEGRHGLEGFEYEGDDEYEHGEPMYEPEHDAETGYTGHGPHRFEYDEYRGEYTHIHTPSTSTPCARATSRSNQMGHVTASNAHISPLIRPCAYINNNPCILTTHTHVPTYTQSHLPTPYITPPVSNYEHSDSDGRGLAPTNHSIAEHPVDYPTTTPSVDYMYLNTLRRNCEEETPSALTWIDGFYDFVDVCELDQEDWEAHKRAEIRKNHWIEYPRRDYRATPRSWDAVDQQSLPRFLEQSRPFYPARKRRHYKNHCAERYPNPRSRSRSPPRSPEQQHLNEDDNIAHHTPPPPTSRSNRHHINNNTPKPPHHVDTRTTPHSISRSRLPPWPIKNQNQNRHSKYHHGTHPPAGTTAKQRLPPWPILPTPTPILSIGSSRPLPWPNIRRRRRKKYSPVSATPPARPPPWPIISHRIHPTLQNSRNAKRRIKAQSRNISDEVSL